jgi:glutaredoxin
MRSDPHHHKDMPMSPAPRKTATLYRMTLPDHLCPSGLKARSLLRRSGYTIDDHRLMTRAETDAFKADQCVTTTPQIFINGRRIGGYTDLRRFLGKPVPDASTISYRPVLVVFAIAGLMALAASLAAYGTPLTGQAFVWAVAFAMCLLAMLKLQDVERFSTMFLNYDLLARSFVPYAYVYPFAEAAAGLLMIAGVLHWLAIGIALVIGTIGAVSVIKAVYIDRRSLKCACVGGNTNVPLGFVSLTENLAMVAMALWMIAR